MSFPLARGSRCKLDKSFVTRLRSGIWYRASSFRHSAGVLSLNATRRRRLSTRTPPNDDGHAPLMEMKNAVLVPPESNKSWGPFNLTIRQPQHGGHVLLGRNGVGKTLIAQSLDDASSYLQSGSISTERNWYSNSVAKVSFDSHAHLAATSALTVSKAIGHGGNLNKAAQFLVVRFGIFPLLHRNVDTLSTGEIRKVLLVRALANRPRLLILDGAFEGLDVASRENLKDIVSKTIQGFRPDILVQAVSAQATAHTQILLITHRSEEIVDEISVCSFWDDQGHLQTSLRQNKTRDELMNAALGVEDRQANIAGDDPTLPSVQQIQTFWNFNRDCVHRDEVLIHAHNLSVTRDGAILLKNLNWKVKRGEHWHIAGGNGAGKSTLSRLLAKKETDAIGELSLATDEVVYRISDRRPGVGWVSTELHLATAKSRKTSQDILDSDGANREEAETVAAWLGINDPALLSQPFFTLSQGQQRIVLIAAAIAQRPSVLVLDEPCQNVDVLSRRRLLGLFELLCKVEGTCLIYITHHPEEVLPSISHVLELDGGTVVYIGTRENHGNNTINSPTPL